MRISRYAWLAGCALMAVLLWCGCATVIPTWDVPPVQRRLTTTGYCKCGDCCGWRRQCLFWPVQTTGTNKGKSKDVGRTASGSQARRGTIAADTSRYPFGTVMYIPGYGYGRVEDRGGDIKGDHIDLYFPSHAAAEDWGRKEKSVTVWFPPSGMRK